MASTTLLLCAFFLALFSYSWSASLEEPSTSDILYTCNQIASAISGASQVFFPPAPEYLFDIEHASSSNTEASACSVEPGSAADLSEILRILGSSQTPFAVKGGGHGVNPGFSSTTGVQIAMSRFNETIVNSASGTVEVGAGLTWDQVYATLGPTGVNLVGARAPGVGVSGSALGGGYSFLSNQYGLMVDNVVGYELVLPNGTVTNVTSNDNDLWFGLRGGLNNFGIVTKFIFQSHPQGGIWGGFRLYAEDQLDAIKEALVEFQQKNDTKAAIDVVLSYSSGQLSIGAIIFYDEPTSSGVFDDFLAIPAVEGNVSTTTFSDFIQLLGPVVAANGYYVLFEGAPVTQYSPAVFDAFANQMKLWGARLRALDQNMSLSSTLEPFNNVAFPSVVTAQWTNASLEDVMASALRNISDTIHALALAEGQNVSHAAVYPNNALFGTPLVDMYGGNVERLRKIRAAIDPEDVMSLTGGWKF
ncbi:FAD dependent oxidoreductase [Russula vinacea]|nr:FAD dependent oxidoreductase [Russula vinacea]